MEDHGWLADRFESHRIRLRGVAYRMLGSLSEADDAVQESWLRLSRTDTSGVRNLSGWLTTVVARVCLDMLRSRKSRREEPLGAHVPDPIVSRANGTDPEQEALLADSVGLALLVVLDTLTPAERLAFVLHDMFGVPFDEIAPLVSRSPNAARLLASRARRRVRGAAPALDADLSLQRKVVDAYLAAARDGDLEALVAVLDPDVVARADGGALRPGGLVRGAEAVAGQAITFARFAHVSAVAQPALVNGAAGVVTKTEEQPISVMAFTITRGKIVAIDILTDPERLRQLDLTVLDNGRLRSGSAGSEPVFQSADGAQGEWPGGRAEQRVQQPHPGEAETAEEGEPGASSLGDGGHPADEEPALQHAPARAQHHVEAGSLAEPAAGTGGQPLPPGAGDLEGSQVGDHAGQFVFQVAGGVPHGGKRRGDKFFRVRHAGSRGGQDPHPADRVELGHGPVLIHGNHAFRKLRRARNSRVRTVAAGTWSSAAAACSSSPSRSRRTRTARCSGVSRFSTSRISAASCGSPGAGTSASSAGMVRAAVRATRTASRTAIARAQP
jgi:RNA polymerase sigma factor (sigma-70 family)